MQSVAVHSLEQILNHSRNIRGLAARMDWISARFLGCGYAVNPLIGSAETRETYTASLAAFDCVTYMETVLALANARTPAGFHANLKRIRYEGGRVDWRRRNHYMTRWIASNVKGGFVLRFAGGGPLRRKDRVLNVVPGLPPVRQRFSCIPKQVFSKAAERIHSGDLLFFASTRAHLDVFHTGIAIRGPVGHGDGRLLLRHASRSQGGVVEQELADFLRKNRMAGVIAVRPVERGLR